MNFSIQNDVCVQCAVSRRCSPRSNKAPCCCTLQVTLFTLPCSRFRYDVTRTMMPALFVYTCRRLIDPSLSDCCCTRLVSPDNADRTCAVHRPWQPLPGTRGTGAEGTSSQTNDLSQELISMKWCSLSDRNTRNG